MGVLLCGFCFDVVWCARGGAVGFAFLLLGFRILRVWCVYLCDFGWLGRLVDCGLDDCLVLVVLCGFGNTASCG